MGRGGKGLITLPMKIQHLPTYLSENVDGEIRKFFNDHFNVFFRVVYAILCILVALSMADSRCYQVKKQTNEAGNW